MVTTKKRTIKGRSYQYVAGSVSYRGHGKRFEKMIGPGDMNPAARERKVAFYSGLMEAKCNIYRGYLKARYTNLINLPGEYAAILESVPVNYREFISSLYPGELEKYRQERDTRHVHNSTAIEGNTLSLRDTALILNDGIAPKGKKLREIHEVENYRKVLEFVRGYTGKLNLKFILRLHGFIQRNIDDNTAGHLRRIDVWIQGSEWTPPSHIFVEEDMNGLLAWYGESGKKMHPFELAVEFHHRFLQIHPFVDGNGRVARELLNHILRGHDLPPIMVPVEEREDYMDCLEAADSGDLLPKMKFFLGQLAVEHRLSLPEQVELLDRNISETVGKLDDIERAEVENVVRWGNELMIEIVGSSGAYDAMVEGLVGK